MALFPVIPMGQMVSQAFTASEIRHHDALGQAPFLLTPIQIPTGQGVLVEGTVMGLLTSTANAGMYVPYLAANSDGSQIPAGILQERVDCTSFSQQALMYVQGPFSLAALQAAVGTGGSTAGNFDAAAQLQLGINYSAGNAANDLYWLRAPQITGAPAGAVAGFTAGSGAATKVDSTYTGNIGASAYTVGDIVAALKQLGAIPK